MRERNPTGTPWVWAPGLVALAFVATEFESVTRLLLSLRGIYANYRAALRVMSLGAYLSARLNIPGGEFLDAGPRPGILTLAVKYALGLMGG